jgi:hypothetical protein
MTRDDHGVLTAFDHELQGDSNRENSWAQSNTYDANGRLSSSALAYRSGIRHVTYAYEYDEGGRLIAVTSVSQDGDLSAKGWTLLYWSPWGSGSWRLITRERGSGSLVRSRDTRYYRDDGRLGTIDFVGGELAADVDGYIDVRATWAYDDAGHLVSHEEDGQEGTDPPHLDGVPDSAATFDAACAGIAVLPVELYGLESWTRLP